MDRLHWQYASAESPNLSTSIKINEEAKCLNNELLEPFPMKYKAVLCLPHTGVLRRNNHISCDSCND